jgi:hypothetical protein
MRTDLFAIALVLFAAFPFAYSLSVLEPVGTVVPDGGEIALGTVGPGQTAYVVVDPIIREGGLQGLGGRLDQLIISGPQGWELTPSTLYETPMKAIIKVPPETQDGVYEFAIKAVDEGSYQGSTGEALGNLSFKATLTVSKGILVTRAWPDKVVTGAGQPAVFYVEITNNGVASDVFEVSSDTVPLWEYKVATFVPRESSKIVRYEIAGNEEQEYNVKINVRAPYSSPLLKSEDYVTLSINTNLVSDLQATGHGLLISPVFEQPVYSLMGLVSNLFFR